LNPTSTQGRCQEQRGPHASSALPGRGVAPTAARARSLARIRQGAAELAAHRRRLLASAIEAEADPGDALLLRVDLPSSRAAVTAATRGGLSPQGLTAAPASHNLSRSAGRAALAPAPNLTEHLGATHPADLLASVDASNITGVAGITATLPHHTASEGDDTVPLTGHIPQISATTRSSCTNPHNGTVNTHSRPPEFAAEPDCDPGAALLLRVSAAGPASDLQPDPAPGHIAGREGLGVDNGIPDNDGIDVPHSAPASAAQPVPDLRLTDQPGVGYAAREGEGSTPSTHPQASSPGRGETAVKPLQER